MPRLPEEISSFMERYGVLADEVWKIPQGAAWALKHKALERVAVEQGITYDRPEVVQIDMANKIVAVVVYASMGEKRVWASGEAAPYNNKNGYPLAMAEKRAKDRCILKLLQIHGTLYSGVDDFEAEADHKRENPHVTKPEDIVPAVEYDQYGEPVDNIPSGDPGIERLPKAKARADFDAAQKEMLATQTPKQLQTWGENNANRLASYPTDWATIMRGLYIEHRDRLRNGAAA